MQNIKDNNKHHPEHHEAGTNSINNENDGDIAHSENEHHEHAENEHGHGHGHTGHEGKNQQESQKIGGTNKMKNTGKFALAGLVVLFIGILGGAAEAGIIDNRIESQIIERSDNIGIERIISIDAIQDIKANIEITGRIEERMIRYAFDMERIGSREISKDTDRIERIRRIERIERIERIAEFNRINKVDRIEGIAGRINFIQRIV